MKKLLYATFALIASVLVLTACSSDNTSSLLLSGDCMVESFELDGTYTGIVDLRNRTVKVKVPASFTSANKAQMKITKLQLSEGAVANMAVGDVIDFSAAKPLHVTNGDLFLDWIINVKNDEAKIISFIINDTYKATVKEEDHTITAYLPSTVDVTSIVPTITLSDDASIMPRDGVPTDFTNPVTYTVTDNTATATYTATIHTETAPNTIFTASAKPPPMDD